MLALPGFILGVVLTCGLAAQELPHWRTQAGDNLSWAAADFDDSAWQTGRWPELTRIFDPSRIYVESKLVNTHGSWLDRDLGAARKVQNSPEWSVDALYLPAKEVGGDFYHTTLAKDGSLLVVTGDVSGKGLPASLLVAAVVGALGDLVSRQPAEVLAHLNRAIFEADGQVVLANVGHLSAWVDGQDVELEAGLPLDILHGVEYQEKQSRRKCFVFVSDGVVEAENAQRELFGFHRTREISTKSAQEIADEAKAWGQNDDITVVTVRRKHA
ncbi:MAG: SpoIIE family protein phosphatase [Acidobacteria bacterium]|nr:SpoIIE family protein phosphatase [Acidobacteriota bacterium]